MSDVTTNPSSSEKRSDEQRTGNAAVPVWLFVLLFVLLYWGMFYFDQHSGWFNEQVYRPYSTFAQVQELQPAGAGNDARGKAVFENVCALCHNADGMGKPNQAPALAGSEWVVGSPNRLIRIPLYGLAGPVSVKGQQWNLAMPAMGSALPEEDLAAVLTYMRSSWGNKATPITPAQVKAIKAEVGNRAQPWTAEQLSAIP